MPSTVELLETLIGQAMTRDVGRFRLRLEKIARLPDADPAWGRLLDDVNRSRELRERRQKSVPHIIYPSELPVSQHKDQILAAIRDHQVVVLAGETGSGKTTQLPKICLELGRGIDGMIGHTQPRRIAARTVAARIADELSTSIGSSGVVGYKVRFTDHSADTSLIKVMTDGILLAETQGDPLLRQYDTIIIDEAHERSLNIDFLLGYLKQLLPKRPDLKVIITSATIDPERFSYHFGNAPMLEVSGRTYPVEVRYKPVRPDEPDTDEDGNPIPIVVDPIEAIVSAVDEVRRESTTGDILVFCATEREIRESASALVDTLPKDFEVLPLFARLSVEDQQRVFKAGHRRRVVLATNVAETSITVPNIVYVIDPGEARMSRYSTRTKVQRLPIEPISQASANQRKGRCGRVAPGICVRLYSEDDFNTRPAFTDPEILRTNLASVILQMIALKLGEGPAGIASFPFLDPPDTRQIRDGYNTLYELGAVTDQLDLTELGRRLSRLPTDPRIGRMILAALDEGVLDEVLVIAAALSVQDPKDRPMELAAQADSAHAHFKDETSDFLGMLKLWEAFQAKSRELSSGRLRRWCRDHFLSYSRLREWQETHRQLRALAAESLAERRGAYRRTQAKLRDARQETRRDARQDGQRDRRDQRPRPDAPAPQPGEGRQGRRGRRNRGRTGGPNASAPAATSAPGTTEGATDGNTPAAPSGEAAVVAAALPNERVRRRHRRGRRGRGPGVEHPRVGTATAPGGASSDGQGGTGDSEGGAASAAPSTPPTNTTPTPTDSTGTDTTTTS